MVYRRYLKTIKGGWLRRVQNLNVNGGGDGDWVKICNNRLISLISKEFLRITSPSQKWARYRNKQFFTF